MRSLFIAFVVCLSYIPVGAPKTASAQCGCICIYALRDAQTRYQGKGFDILDDEGLDSEKFPRAEAIFEELVNSNEDNKCNPSLLIGLAESQKGQKKNEEAFATLNKIKAIKLLKDSDACKERCKQRESKVESNVQRAWSDANIRALELMKELSKELTRIKISFDPKRPSAQATLNGKKIELDKNLSIDPSKNYVIRASAPAHYSQQVVIKSSDIKVAKENSVSFALAPHDPDECKNIEPYSSADLEGIDDERIKRSSSDLKELESLGNSHPCNPIVLLELARVLKTENSRQRAENYYNKIINIRINAKHSSTELNDRWQNAKKSANIEYDELRSTAKSNKSHRWVKVHVTGTDEDVVANISVNGKRTEPDSRVRVESREVRIEVSAPNCDTKTEDKKVPSGTEKTFTIDLDCDGWPWWNYVAIGSGALLAGYAAVGIAAVVKTENLDASDNCIGKICNADGIADRDNAIDFADAATVLLIMGGVTALFPLMGWTDCFGFCTESEESRGISVGASTVDGAYTGTLTLKGGF